jgi:hypothetical protein
MRIVGLPFGFEVRGDVASGGPAKLTVMLQAPLIDEAFDQLRCAVAWFARLGELGGLGGARITPAHVRAQLASDEPDARSLHPSWSFDALRVDPAAMVILANLIYATGHGVRRVGLLAQGTDTQGDLEADAYPRQYPGIAFAIDDRRTDRNVQLSIEFIRDVADAVQPPLVETLQLWSLVGALGGFREPGDLREQMDLIPEDDPEFVLDELSFVFRDNGMNDAAYAALLNVLERVSQQQAPIQQVSLK